MIESSRYLLLEFGIVLLLSVLAAHAQPGASVKTKDGFELRLAPNGFVAAIRVARHGRPLSREPALFRLRDAAAKSRLVPVRCMVLTESQGLRLLSTEKPLGMDLRARLVSRGDFLQIDGEVAEHAGRDHCLDLKISLPVATNGFVWGTALADIVVPKPAGQKGKKNAPAEIEIDESIPDDNAWYPLSAASNPELKAGLSLAVPPTHPTRFLTGKDGSGPFILLRLGLSPSAATPGRTSFRIILYRHDPAWGFRSSLKRYYDFYISDLFIRRAKRIGAWTAQNASRLKHPELYAYHEAGFPTWRHPGDTRSGVNIKPSVESVDQGPAGSSLGEYEKLCELSSDKKFGIYSLPYTIVGQRQFMQLPDLPDRKSTR